MENESIIMHTVEDVKRIFRCSRSQAYKLVNASGFPSMRIGGKILVENNLLNNWIRMNKGKTVAVC